MKKRARILTQQPLPFWECIQILARRIFRRTDDAHRRIELNATILSFRMKS
jgi:hypothetical protein